MDSAHTPAVSCSAVTRARLEMQGFAGLDDDRIIEIRPWLRVAPALCATWAAIAALLGSPAGFWTLVPIALMGALRTSHPFDIPYNQGFRRLFGTRPLPPYGRPRRFACAIATLWLMMVALTFEAERVDLGSALASAFVVTALIPVMTDFCVPSFVYTSVARLRRSLHAR